ncbi:MAG: helix-turn-helix domain-containing protein [Planctomycetota bacterium]
MLEEERRAAALTRELVERIRAHRKKRGITQAEVARRMVMPASVVARLENTPHNCTMRTILLYADAAEAVLSVRPAARRKKRGSK